MKKILIAGGGVAAYEAALAASAMPDIRVTLCSEEAVPPYRRPALSRMVAEETADNAFYFKPADFYRERNIDLRLGAEIISIDRQKKTAALRDGTVLPYDALILATGGYAFVPPLPGAEHVRVLRNYRDLLEIRRLLEAGLSSAVIAGAGVLGMELADSLLRKGCAVTLLEAGPTVLPRNLDTESAQLVMKHLAALPGLTFRTGASVRKVTATGVELADGIAIEADAVFFSTGVRCCSKLAADAGLQVGRGIVTDDRMRTSDPAVFACGDAAEPPGGPFGLLNAARAMGRAAGVNAADGDEVFVPESYPVRLAALGLKLFSAGKTADARAEFTQNGEASKCLIYDASGRLSGAVLLGDLSEGIKLQKELAR